MKPSPDYLAVESNAPFRGLASSPPSTRIDPSYSPSLLNVTVRDGIIRRRSGYSRLGQRLVGRVLAITEFGPIDAQPYFVVLTSHRQYYYNPTTSRFVDLTPNQVSYPITNQNDKNFMISGNHTAEFPTGRLFPVVGSTANDGVYTVASVSFSGGVTTVEIVETVPNPSSVDGAIVLANDLTTTEDDFIDYAVATDVNGHRLIITNGVNPPRMWDGNPSHTFTTWTPTGITGFITCKTLAVFTEHLFLGNIRTASVEPLLVAWSRAGNFDDFDTGDSGVQLLNALRTPILKLKVLGDRLVIYSSDAIMASYYVGLPTVFAFEVVIPEGTRLASPTGILSIDVGHIFASDENIYLFDGSRGLRILGEAIYTDYKATKSYEHLRSMAVLNDYSKRTLYFAVPDIEGDVTIYTMLYNTYDLSQISWSKEKYLHQPTAFGFFVNRSTVLTWDDAPWERPGTTWAEEVGTWAEEGEQLGFPIRCFGTANGEVFVATEGALTDFGGISTQRYETMDFTVPEVFHSAFGRWIELEFEGRGTTVDVSYSTDLGSTFTHLETVTLSDSFRHYRVPFDTTSRMVRFRFSSTTGDFSLRWIRTWVRQGAPR